MAEHCPACGHKLGPDAVLEWGGWRLDESDDMLSFSGKNHKIRHQDCIIIGILLRNRGRVVSKESIYSVMYGQRPECDQPESTKVLDVRVHYLRNISILLHDNLQTVYGRGFRLAPLVTT